MRRPLEWHMRAAYNDAAIALIVLQQLAILTVFSPVLIADYYLRGK